MQVFKQIDSFSAAAEAGEHLNALLMEHKNRPILLMLSGGSALSILEYVGQSAFGANLTICVLDERFSADPAINNFARLQKTEFYTGALTAECSFFGTLPRNGEKMENLTERWEKNLKQWREENPNGMIVATLGMGQDGHTAGIFPFDDAKEFNKLFCGDAWLTAYNAGDKNKFSERITTTLTFLKLLDFGLVYVCGKEKKEKLEAVLAARGQIHQLPALAWQEIKNVKIFTDIGGACSL